MEPIRFAPASWNVWPQTGGRRCAPRRRLPLSPEERPALERLARSDTASAREARGTLNILSVAQGKTNHEIAEALGTGRVRCWRAGYRRGRLNHPPNLACPRAPAAPRRDPQDFAGPAVHRQARAHHRLVPVSAEHALVFCCDEKSQVQALDRTHPGLPMNKDRAATMTHDDKRHGATTWFAALNVLDGQVIGQCQPRHTHVEWLKFLRQIDREPPKEKTSQLICDHYATHKHPNVQK